MFKRIVSIVLFLLFFGSSFGQNISLPITLQWQALTSEQIGNDKNVSYIYFDGAKINTGQWLTPYFEQYIPIGNIHYTYSVEIKKQIWQLLSDKEMATLDTALFSNELIVNHINTETRKQAYLCISFYPFRKIGSKIEKLVSFEISTIETKTLTKVRKTPTYASSSILSSGDFYKLSITQTGIHKISYENLKSMGMSLPVNISNIALFGNGGQQLPQSTSDKVFDDLQEVAISVVDNNNNGLLESNDYILFYAVGLSTWKPSNIDPLCQFEHNLNVYANQTYYFITATPGVGTKKRIGVENSLSSTPTHSVNTYYYHSVYEKDNINICKIGTRWFSDDYKTNTKKTYSFKIPGITSRNIYLNMYLATTATTSSSFKFTINNNKTFTQNFYVGNSIANVSYKNYTPTGEDLSIAIEYSKPNLSSAGYLDYIEVHATCNLGQNSGQVDFRNPEIVGTGNIAQYFFNTYGKNTQIWDVTDQHQAKKIVGTMNGNTFTFTLAADSLKEMVAFDGSSFLTVTPIGKIDNQNLHALQHLDFIIITAPEFLNAANNLADFRTENDNMRVAVVTTTQIYNEFSSGGTDISAIRNFLKMLYEKGSSENDIPKCALLFGKTSYDPRQIDGNAVCYIPNYQGVNIFDNDNNVSCDNYFGKLADGKGINNFGTLDIGIGRFPVNSATLADAMVEKSKIYAATTNLEGTSGKVSNLGNWRNLLTFISDDDGDYAHMFNPENICNAIIKDDYPTFNIDKIYSDSYKKEVSAQGTRYPEVNKAINYRVNNGCLLLSYFGHGGDNGWSHERILTIGDINTWTNKYAMPIFFTACCSFGAYDKATFSPAERILLNTKGGAMGLIASTRNSSSYPNEYFGRQIYKYALSEGKDITIGEIYAKAQNAYGMYESYSYFGDPSAKLAFPKINVITDSINGQTISLFKDTLKSLTYVNIKGHIATTDGNINPNFNGWIYPTIYDKPTTVTTINNNGKDSVYHYEIQKSILFKGKSKVENGYFSFSFILPKDIDYNYGYGKISYYATGDNTDANGYQNVLIGGLNDTTINDDEGPVIQLTINDDNFVSGSITTSTPIVKATISDNSGINTAGAGIGHDLQIIIDDDIANAINVNDYFTFEENSFTKGTLNYALSTLKEGVHKLKVRAWDIVNNMGENAIEFEVVNNEEIQLQHVLNYPNPFTTSTSFFFEHNQPNVTLDINITIFTIGGKVVKCINDQQTNAGFRSNAIQWDGRDDYGNKIGKGVYIYRLRVRKEDGTSAEKIEKIVIL